LRCIARSLSCTCSPIHATNSPPVRVAGLRRDGRKAKRPTHRLSLKHIIILAGFRSYVQPRSSNRLRLATAFPTGKTSGACTLDEVRPHWQAVAQAILLKLEGNQAEARLMRVRGATVVRCSCAGMASRSVAKALSCSAGRARRKDFTSISASRRHVVKS